ncbi:hypothetical protein [Isoptericola aurantiacus]|uniref:hypothetical protein n=1 Tax=Isoptericola aurantiacus TaxID=3377839 RepID=UPI00383AE633
MAIDVLARDDAASILAHEVRELVRRRGIDPVTDRRGLERLVSDAVADYAERASAGLVPVLPDPAAVSRSLADELGGLGPLQVYLDDPEIEEI